ncbi:scp-like extracellular [Phlyctema vagabunda]|uniref:Scp-like extracellular n=1 Tax=Phlyctema vagabunda TaxID=108571 RepID=A0ABR4P6M5_9HELO
MRASTILGLAGAASMAIASPLKLEKKAYKYETVTHVVYVTVTEGDLPTAPPAQDTTIVIASTVYVAPTSIVPVVSDPVSVPTATEIVVVPTTEATVIESTSEAAPVPTTTEQVVTMESTPAEVASTTTAPAPASPTDFDSACLYHHNVHRANHSVSDFTYSAEIAGYAQTLSDRCSNAHDVSIGGGGYGQNIASYGATGDESISKETIIAAVISNMWYNGEVGLYSNFYGQANPTVNFEAWGHFSQVVWKGTTKVGCGVTLCAPGTIFNGLSTWFAVCNYESAGNVGGQYAANVLPPTMGADSTITVDL